MPAEDETVSVPQSPHFTLKQIEEWTKAPDIQGLVGVLKELRQDISAKDIREMRLKEKYKV
jgi:hypothetical protein